MENMHVESLNKKILIIDDDELVREVLDRYLSREGYDCYQAESAEQALEILEKNEFPLALCDINMPGLSGIDLLERAKKIYPDMAIVMASAVDDRSTAIRTLELGAYGYVIKPFEANEVLINVTNALRRRYLEIENNKHRAGLEKLVWEKTRELQKAKEDIKFSREETIERLSKAAEFRDDETAQHTTRMSHYCKLLAQEAKLPSDFCELIRIASPLHDVGKIGISDTILKKPGKLTADEFNLIKQHTTIGFRILNSKNSDLLIMASSIALTHHERIDGTGYPNKITGEKIPIEGKIAAVCDVFDALTSDRIYKKAFPVEMAIEIMTSGRGNHFDQDLLDLFFNAMDEVLRIRKQFADQ